MTGSAVHVWRIGFDLAADSHQTAARWSLLKFRRSTAGIANAAKPDARSGRASIVAPSTKATAR